ncbi:UDP-4-amino-4-deoxy-L-arabinose--oxoglutarate aminotransferase [uncultured archaeon]|nr:UDP-4-amino-4-deoxy-L-arabinose--oxoglutarate aminotransferase [uncultured archaeon]
MELIIEPLTKEHLEKRINDLFELESDWTRVGETSWNHESFNLELPGKWELSLFASLDQKIVGYAIASYEGNIARLNKLVVDNNFRRMGIATRLWESILKKCREIGAHSLEFKVLMDNYSAIEFYKNKKCIINGTSQGTDGKDRHNVRYVFKTEIIRHSRPTIEEDDAKAVYDILKSGNINTKEIVSEFTGKFTNFVGKRFGAATNSGTSALYLALRVLDISEGDEVIIPSYVCESVLNAVTYSKATPVIADINPDYNLSFEDTQKKINPKTKAIILPHMFGSPSSETEEFVKLGIPIIEDCATSVGAEHNNQKVGSFGNISIFSFYATKVITTGMGGMLATDDPDVTERVNDLLKHDNRTELGENYNYGMNDVQAALGITQLNKIDYFIDKRKEIAEIYGLLLKDSKFSLPNNSENIFFRYIIKTDNAEKLIENLRSRGIEASRPVFIPLHRYLKLPDLDFPNTVSAYNESVSIPIYPTMTKQEIYDTVGIMLNSESNGGLE